MENMTGADFKSATVEDNKKLFIETYGCQMNVADSEVIASVMQMAGYSVAESLDEALPADEEARAVAAADAGEPTEEKP